MALAIKTKSRYYFSLKLLDQAFDDLLEVISAKGSFYIKARDLTRYCDIIDHSRLTRLGRLLSILAKLGLAKRHNERRPVRYSLTPPHLWYDFIDLCGSLPPMKRYQCMTDGSVCGLVGVCPYWRTKEVLEANGP